MKVIPNCFSLQQHIFIVLILWDKSCIRLILLDLLYTSQQGLYAHIPQAIISLSSVSIAWRFTDSHPEDGLQPFS